MNRRIRRLVGKNQVRAGCSAAVGCALLTTLLSFDLYADPPVAPPMVEATGGAAPGYVDDQLCSTCHGEIFDSYQEVGMARSFFRPSAERRIEDFSNNHFFHEASQNHYEMIEANGTIQIHRYQVSPSGQKVNVFQQKVDWILGSGNHSRTYLYQNEIGELYQLPIAWYTQPQGWGMAPGYDQPEHNGMARRVQRECMFCHNAFPDVPTGSDGYGEPHTFPADLPEGTGCQRCHGPGQRHVQVALDDTLGLDDPASTIVNPGRLEPELRNDVCYQCHMQPSVALPGIRLFDQGDYSFRPGDSLAAHFAQMDVVEENREGENRFEINHHPYRLEQSQCFQKSNGALSCLSCHDPHRKVAPQNRVAHYRAACLQCHTEDSCGIDTMAEIQGAAPSHEQLQDCSSCHMPKHRTADVVHVVMTDHRIGLWPDLDSLLAAREERDPVIVDVLPLRPDQGPQGELGDIYRAAAVLRAGGGEQAVGYLETLLAKVEPPELEPWLRLARAQLQMRPPVASIQTLERILHRSPGHPLATEWLALARARAGNPGAAETLLRVVLDARPRRPEAHFNLGGLLLAEGRTKEAVHHLRRATELRPNFVAAWFHLGNSHRRQGETVLAIVAYQKTLAIDPRHEKAYVGMAEALASTGNRASALGLLRHGLSILGSSPHLEAAIGRLEARSDPGT